MGKRGLLGGILGAIGGAAVGGPIGALAGAAIVGGAAKSTESRYVTVHEHERRIGGCFIATACYGKSSKEVKILRLWRDNKLSKNYFGKGLIDFYYNISPPIANFISDKPLLKKSIALVIKPIVKLVE